MFFSSSFSCDYQYGINLLHWSLCGKSHLVDTVLDKQFSYKVFFGYTPNHEICCCFEFFLKIAPFYHMILMEYIKILGFVWRMCFFCLLFIIYCNCQDFFFLKFFDCICSPFVYCNHPFNTFKTLPKIYIQHQNKIPIWKYKVMFSSYMYFCVELFSQHRSKNFCAKQIYHNDARANDLFSI